MPRMVSAPNSLNARRNVPKPQPTSTTLLGCKTGYNLPAIIRGAIMLKYFSSCEYGTLTVNRDLWSICIVPELTPKWRRLYFSIRSTARGIFNCEHNCSRFVQICFRSVFIDDLFRSVFIDVFILQCFL